MSIFFLSFLKGQDLGLRPVRALGRHRDVQAHKKGLSGERPLGRIGYERFGGDNWFRTSDLLLVEQALSLLSYAPANQSD